MLLWLFEGIGSQVFDHMHSRSSPNPELSPRIRLLPIALSGDYGTWNGVGDEFSDPDELSRLSQTLKPGAARWVRYAWFSGGSI
jgi:hypothetical protein